MFTLSPDELASIKHYDANASIYFIIKLTLFKLRRTFIEISETNMQKWILHLQKRYFPSTIGQAVYFPLHARTQLRIENKILELCRHQRCRGQVLTHLKKRLSHVAARYPRQRALCKTAIDICRFEKIALPALSTLENIVSTI